MRALIAGFGFLGQRIAAELGALGYELTVIRRSAGIAEIPGVDFVQCDLIESSPKLAHEDFEIAVFCLAPGARAPDLYRNVYCTAQQNFLANIRTAQYIYVSSTAVYPEKTGTYYEKDGSSHSERAEILLDAEKIALSRDACVLRLAGLYSAERSIYGRSASAYTEDKLVHFIHRDDAAAAVRHAATKSLKGVFNVHDGNPLWRSSILTGLGLTPAIPRQIDSRLISAEKFSATGFNPQYKNYFEGISPRALKS